MDFKQCKLVKFKTPNTLSISEGYFFRLKSKYYCLEFTVVALGKMLCDDRVPIPHRIQLKGMSDWV